MGAHLDRDIHSKMGVYLEMDVDSKMGVHLERDVHVKLGAHLKRDVQKWGSIWRLMFTQKWGPISNFGKECPMKIRSYSKKRLFSSLISRIFCEKFEWAPKRLIDILRGPPFRTSEFLAKSQNGGPRKDRVLLY